MTVYEELIAALNAADKRRCSDLECPGSGECPTVGCLFREAADAIEELSRENESLAKSVNEASEILRRRWISTSERLPKYGERVLVFGGFTMYVAYYDKNKYGGESWHKLNSKSHYCNPTHWMPLPTPPKEATE